MTSYQSKFVKDTHSNFYRNNPTVPSGGGDGIRRDIWNSNIDSQKGDPKDVNSCRPLVMPITIYRIRAGIPPNRLSPITNLLTTETQGGYKNNALRKT